MAPRDDQPQQQQPAAPPAVPPAEPGPENVRLLDPLNLPDHYVHQGDILRGFHGRDRRPPGQARGTPEDPVVLN